MLSYPESPIQVLQSPLLSEKKIRLLVKRDDLNHPVISGNKLRKLKYNIEHAKKQQYQGLLTFGGAFSNHLYATAMACKLAGLDSVIIVRGTPLDANNPTLKIAKACGARLIAVDRKTYRRRYEDEYLQELKQSFPHYWVVPEGGSNQLALPGLLELAASLPPCDTVACAVGSGGTLAGLALGLQATKRVLGFAVLKDEHLQDEILEKYPELHQHTHWQLFEQFHEGGYGRFTPELWAFCQAFTEQHHIPIEPIYTGKLFYGLWQLIQADYFAPETTICAVHTGGLQGLMGLKYRGLI
ncbi:1-aminocyclopropane-1-carboxylate deaminase/D-cysteine desulfhydrase [Pseudoalteromonas xiamenensis]